MREEKYLMYLFMQKFKTYETYEKYVYKNLHSIYEQSYLFF